MDISFKWKLIDNEFAISKEMKMAYIKEYWADKEKRAEQAKRHTKEMQKKYGNGEIAKAIENTKIYDTDFQCDKDLKEQSIEIVVDDLDTVHASRRYCNSGKVALLNFSSYKNPGGMFISGSKAQEECLCHASYLYNVLSKFVINFYDWNNRHKNKSMYLNRALYSPDILFQYGEVLFKCDVITCAAPNKSAAQKYQNVSDEENLRALRSRIRFVLDIAKDNDVNTLILGAYGCGVFGQNAKEVASIFKEYLTSTHKCFERVIFAIPDGRDGNLKLFREVFNG